MKKSITIEIEYPNDDPANVDHFDDLVTLTIVRHDGSKLYEITGRNTDINPVSLVVHSPLAGRIPADPFVGNIIV